MSPCRRAYRRRMRVLDVRARIGAVNWDFGWWQVLGSNQRRLSRRFYRPLPLATRATCRKPPSRDGTLKDSGTFPMRQHPGV